MKSCFLLLLAVISIHCTAAELVTAEICRIPTKKNDINAAQKFPDYFVHFSVGSLKAACTFAEKFINTRFVVPSRNNYGEHEGVRTRPLSKVALDDKFAYHGKGRRVSKAQNKICTNCTRFSEETSSGFISLRRDKQVERSGTSSQATS